MFTAKATVNSIFREHAEEFCNKHNVSDHSKKVIRAIVNCRTVSLGGRIQKCDNCGDEIILYNSCRNRHCPQCQFKKKEKWIAERRNDIFPFQYFHVVFTIPESLNPIIFRNKKQIYKLLFDSSKDALLSISENKKYFGARIGFFSILHTWGQKLNFHPHIHAVVPGGGYVAGKEKWKRSPENYLVPVKVLSKKFRYVFLNCLKGMIDTGEISLDNTIYEDRTIFRNLLDTLFAKDWIVYVKESFKNSDSVIDYLGKYTHRIAISNYRIISSFEGKVKFLYRDYSDCNKEKILDMPVERFMKNFLNHVVPKRFVRIRYYGILSNSTKRKELKKCREYYSVKESHDHEQILGKKFQNSYDSIICAKCRIGKMIMSDTIPALNIRAGPA